MIIAAGILLQAPTGRVLLLRRSNEGDMAGTWAIPGGKLEDSENAEGAAVRETLEETGYRVGHPGVLLMRRVSGDVDYTTFHKQIDDEFIPKLNDEHTAFAWVIPKEMIEEQPAVAATPLPGIVT